jgi:hypothetical protein
MKKLLSLTLAFALCFSLAACAPKESSSQVEEVSVILPAYIVNTSGSPEEDYLAFLEADDRVISAYFNDDGTVTLIMTKVAYTEMMQEMMTSLEEDLANYVTNESSSFSEITHDTDITEFNFFVDRTQYENGYDHFYVTSVGVFSTYFHIYFGKPEFSITLNVIDEATGEIFETLIYPDDLFS